MLALLTLGSCAADFPFDHETSFFPPRLVRAGETVTASFPPDSVQAIFLWQSRTSGVTSHLSLTAENGSVSHLSLSSDSGVRVIGRAAALNFSSDVQIQAWLIGSALCPDLVFFYSAPVAFTDDLRPSAATEFCAFFAHTHFHATLDGNAGAALFTAANVREPTARCRGRQCTFESAQASFLRVSQIEAADHITLELTGKTAIDEPCDRFLIPLVGNSVQPPPLPFDPPKLLSCFVHSPYRSPFVIFAIFFMVIICTSLLILFGWCSRVQHRVRILLSGANDVNRDIDPKQLLREDQIQNLVSIVPEGEEEDAADRVT